MFISHDHVYSLYHNQTINFISPCKLLLKGLLLLVTANSCKGLLLLVTGVWEVAILSDNVIISLVLYCLTS